MTCNRLGKKFAIALIAIAPVASFGVNPSPATAITWELQNVSFNNGAIATGTFDYNAATNTFSNIDVRVSAAPFNLNTGTARSVNADLEAAFFDPSLVTGSGVEGGIPGLFLDFNSALTNNAVAPVVVDSGTSSLSGAPVNLTFINGTLIGVGNAGNRANAGGTVVPIAPTTWQINNLGFTNGLFAAGTFSYDAIANTFSNIDVYVTTLSAPDLNVGANRSARVGQEAAFFDPTLVTGVGVESGIPGLFLDFNGVLTDNAVDPIAVNSGVASLSGAPVNFTFINGNLIGVSSIGNRANPGGSVVPLPTPIPFEFESTLGLITLAGMFGGYMLLKNKKRKKLAA
jgi:hypothetical protein